MGLVDATNRNLVEDNTQQAAYIGFVINSKALEFLQPRIRYIYDFVNIHFARMHSHMQYLNAGKYFAAVLEAERFGYELVANQAFLDKCLDASKSQLDDLILTRNSHLPIFPILHLHPKNFTQYLKDITPDVRFGDTATFNLDGNPVKLRLLINETLSVVVVWLEAMKFYYTEDTFDQVFVCEQYVWMNVLSYMGICTRGMKIEDILAESAKHL
jgi:hypothetical protein